MSEYEEDLENDESLTSKDDRIYPNATVKIDKLQYSAFELKRQYEDKKRQNIILNPDFQRGKVWTEGKQKSELIESILMGIPLPVIYLFETIDGKKEVVDGRQRITTLIEFMNNEFKLKSLQMLPNINNQSFDELDPFLQAKIEDYPLSIFVIQPPTPERVKFDIFDRVNRGGTQLNNQEMRNALYRGNSTKLLKELSELEIFKRATNKKLSSKRMKDRFLILRFIGFYLLKMKKIDIEYKSNINDFSAEVMKYLNEFENYSDILYLKDIFINAMQISIQLFDGEGFIFESTSDIKRHISAPLFDVLTYLYTLIDDDINFTDFKQDVIVLKKEFDSGTYFRKSIESTKSMEYRYSKVEELGKKYAK
ncbi:MAG: DUF262 domain-containing protein [Campylobacterota bacterium]|nr:DUF262 domain-containing protein [Campylobacterota bacterium]